MDRREKRAESERKMYLRSLFLCLYLRELKNSGSTSEKEEETG